MKKETASAKRQRERRARGLCCSCGQPAEPGKARCPDCKQKAKDRYEASKPPKPVKPAKPPKGFDFHAWHRQRYDGRKAAGLCVGCGKQPPGTASVYCDACLNRQREKQKVLAVKKGRQRRQEQKEVIEFRRELETCLGCGDPAKHTKTLCRRCEAKRLERNGMPVSASRKAVGLCRGCDQVIESGVRCDQCREKDRTRHHERVAAGLCGGCSEPLAPGDISYCSSCRKKSRQRHAARHAAGLCVGCGKIPPDTGFRRCAKCLLDNRQKLRREHARLRSEVLAAYGGACQCCGETTPEFLQVDHVNNDGAVHRRAIHQGKAYYSGMSIYRWLRKNDFPQDGFQLLCANCNYAKARYGSCPHTAPVVS